MLEGKLRDALANDELDVFLQPKFDLQHGKVDTFEALVRWTDDELGVLNPAEFVDVAERAGMIEPLTEVVVAQVTEWISEFPKDVVRRIAINLSPAQLSAPGFEHKFLSMLRRHKYELDRLEVEVTESIFVTNPQAAREKLSMLRDHGIKVSLDDFGTGFSSLNLIMHLPLDALKIDKTFVDNIVGDRQTSVVVAKIIEMATSLGIEVIAEGVENEFQIKTLQKMGCTDLQGHVISEPLDQVSAAAFIRQYRGDPRAVFL